MTQRADRIDVIELAQAVRRGWRALAACTILGALGAIAVLMFAPRRFAGTASVVVKTAPAPGAPAPLETEVAILSSRALVGPVIDSLGLQVDVTSPRSVAGRDVVGQSRLKSAFPKVTYAVEQLSGARYRLTAGEKHFTADAGEPVTLPEGNLVLRGDTILPSRFTFRLLDREDALLATQRRLSASKTTGSEVLTITFQASDSTTAAAFPNALIADYLARRRTVDRGEGGDVQQLDVATPPKRVVFPQPAMTMGIGIGAGLFFGVVMALFAGMLGRYVEDPQSIERTTGVPALRLDTSVPLLVSGNATSSTLLLVPIDGRVSTAGVAERLARVALARGNEPTVLDLSGAGSLTQSTSLTTDVNAVMTRLEARHAMVIVRLPALAADETAAALRPERTVVFVAPPGRLERRLLIDAVQMLRRLDVPCAGVVVNRASDSARV